MHCVNAFDFNLRVLLVKPISSFSILHTINRFKLDSFDLIIQACSHSIYSRTYMDPNYICQPSWK